MTALKVGAYRIELSNLDKILFPKSRISKGDLVQYYAFVAPYMLPHCKNRLISMLRYPEGITHEGFYQKNAGDYFPDWIERYTLSKSSGDKVHYVVIKNQATLVYLANQGCITPHIWLSSMPKVDMPDRLIFDLDPSGKKFNFEHIKEAANVLKPMLEARNLKPYLMTTGSRGLHVVVPLRRTKKFDEVRAIAKSIAEQVVQHNPRFYTTELSKAKRGSKIFIDYLRNSFGATSVAPYAVRPLEGAPVATPIGWKELAHLSSSQEYTMATLPARIKKIGDLWADMNRHARVLR